MGAAAAQTNGAATKGAPPPAASSNGGDEAEAPSLVDMLTGAAEMPVDEDAPADEEPEANGAPVEAEDPEETDDEDDDGEPSEAEDADDDGDTDDEPDENQIASEEAFSEAALKTAAGVKRAREIVLAEHKAAQQRQKRLDRFDTRLHKREKSHRARVAVEAQEIEQQKSIGRHVVALVAQTRKGTAAERLAALSALAGQPGLEFLEELNMGVLSDGKKTTSPEIERLRGELHRLENALLEKQQQDEQAAEQRDQQAKLGRIEQHKREAAELGADAEKYPAIAAEIKKWGGSMREQVGDWVVRKITSHYKRTGQRLDKAKALGILNARLVKAAGGAPSEPRKGSAVRDPVKSPVAQRRSAGRGVTVTSDLADRSTGIERELDRDERIAELSRDRDALRELGLGQFLE
jgi:hypothetical protein